MWQTDYASAVPNNLGVGVDFGLCSEDNFFTGHPLFMKITLFCEKLNQYLIFQGDFFILDLSSIDSQHSSLSLIDYRHDRCAGPSDRLKIRGGTDLQFANPILARWGADYTHHNNTPPRIFILSYGPG